MLLHLRCFHLLQVAAGPPQAVVVAAQTPLAVPVDAKLGAVLHQQWSAAEGAFLEGLLRLFVQFRGQQEHYPAHFAGEWAVRQFPSSKKSSPLILANVRVSECQSVCLCNPCTAKW